MFAPDLTNENARAFSRLDKQDPLSTCSPHPIVLEDVSWLTCEHYYSANVVRSPVIAEKIAREGNPVAAYELAKPWYRWKRADFKNVRAVLMTRALYTKVQMYPEVREALEATGNNKIIERSIYDHYWGIGRDQRGENQLGKIWTDIRERLRSASENTKPENT